jgi:hypothetical protein
MSSKTAKTTKKTTESEVKQVTEKPVQKVQATAKPVDKVVAKPADKVAAKASVKVKDVTTKADSSDSDEESSEDEKELVNHDDSDEEEQSDDEEESDEEQSDDEEEQKPKKIKETYAAVAKRTEELKAKKKELYKKIAEADIARKTLEREMKDIDRELVAQDKIKDKCHIDEVNAALKQRPKRKGNVNGGFLAASDVPDILRKFLDLPEDTKLNRPGVMSKFNTKLANSGQKEGQTAILNKDTLKALGLSTSDAPKHVKFTEMMSFISQFYPETEKKKSGKVEVEV